MGTPPRSDFPSVTASGSRPQAAVQPPGPALSVCVSSMMSSAPWRVHSSRTASRKPGSGSTIPMLVRAGSISTQATSPWASASSTVSISLNSAARVVLAGSTIGPTLPSREWVSPPSPRTTNDSSTEPW